MDNDYPFYYTFAHWLHKKPVVNMVGTTFADRLALAKMILQWFEMHNTELSEKGILPDYWIQNIENGIEGVVHTNDIQESLKAQQKSSTRDLERWDNQLYKLVSGAIDAAVGAYGKSSPEGKQLSRFRSKLHRSRNQEVEEETTE